MKPKRFLVFTGDYYYPAGGWEDLQGSYDTIEEAVTALNQILSNDWSYIIDLETGKTVVDQASIS